jgi:hypothetical protein
LKILDAYFGSKNFRALGMKANRSRKQELWQSHTCHFPFGVSTVIWLGADSLLGTSFLQKQHGLKATPVIF